MKISDEEKKQLETVRLAVLRCIEHNAQAGDSEGAEQAAKAYQHLAYASSSVEIPE